MKILEEVSIIHPPPASPPPKKKFNSEVIYNKIYIEAKKKST